MQAYKNSLPAWEIKLDISFINPTSSKSNAQVLGFQVAREPISVHMNRVLILEE
jgi:hypothetical protein